MPLAAEVDPAQVSARTARTRRHPIYSTPALEFVALPHHASAPFRTTLPAPGELYLWRYHAEWQAISHDDPRSCISRAEYQWAKHYPNSALAKRYLIGCAALRFALAPMLACAPEQLEFGSAREGRLALLHPEAGSAIQIHIAFASVWVLIAVSNAAMGIGSATPGRRMTAPNAGAPTLPHRRAIADQSDSSAAMEHSTETHWQARYASLSDLAGRTLSDADVAFFRQNGASSTLDANDGQRYHVLDLPMPGRLCSAIALAEPVWTVYASGWLRS
ncbi:4'-phosphopantetheinyl transferase family protein [Paraburkholderia ferrariae]|uniref:hypothetical protein n=1 Tax=Paraburkholderia ferrariae TaxID=386056 RepID=UPI0012EC72D3|nr:hypothetical protein [Paraburkholderia ferrariae]